MSPDASVLADTASAVEKSQKQRPSWDDLRSELGVTPTVGADGVPQCKVEGHDKVVRMLEMYRKSYDVMGDHGLERQARQKKVLLKCKDGRVREVHESQEDRVGRKFSARPMHRTSRHRTVWMLDDAGEPVVVQQGYA